MAQSWYIRYGGGLSGGSLHMLERLSLLLCLLYLCIYTAHDLLNFFRYNLSINQISSHSIHNESERFPQQWKESSSNIQRSLWTKLSSKSCIIIGNARQSRVEGCLFNNRFPMASKGNQMPLFSISWFANLSVECTLAEFGQDGGVSFFTPPGLIPGRPGW